MTRVILALIVGIACFYGLSMFLPQSTGKAFEISGYTISFCLIFGLVAFGFAWKRIK